MKSILIFVLSLAMVMANGQTTQLRLASDVWPPFTNVDSAHAVAFDLVKEALARTKIQAHMSILDFKDVMGEIQSGKFDGSAALWKSPEREAYLLYSEPYLENRLILVGKKGSNVSATSFSALKGKRIAIVGTYAYGVLPKDIELVTGISDQQNLENVLNGKADYMLVDALLIQYLLEYQSKEATEHLEIGKNTLLTRPLHFAIRKDLPDASTIIKHFNEEIKKMTAEGTYNKILNLNWIATDVDGDGRTELVLNGEHAGLKAPENPYLVGGAPDLSTAGTNGYYIKGIYYKDWEHVPDKYKVVPQGSTPAPQRGGLAVFHF